MSAVNLFLLVIQAPGKSKLAYGFLSDALFIFDFDVCVGIEENLVLNQEVA